MYCFRWQPPQSLFGTPGIRCLWNALGYGKLSVGPPYFDAVFVAADAGDGDHDGSGTTGALEKITITRFIHAGSLGAWSFALLTGLLLPWLWATGRC